LINQGTSQIALPP